MSVTQRGRWIVVVATAAWGVSSIAGCGGENQSREHRQSAARQEGGAPAVRIGTVKRDRLVMAYYASEIVGEDLRKLKEAHAAAVAAGDHARAAELERQGAAMQNAAHKQMWEDAPLDPIMERLREQLPMVARGAGVDRIVEEAAAPKGAASVDVTDQVVALLPMRSDLKERDAASGR